MRRGRSIPRKWDSSLRKEQPISICILVDKWQQVSLLDHHHLTVRKKESKTFKRAGKGGADYSALIKTRTYASLLFERWHIPGHMYETGTSNHLGSVFVMLKNNWTNCQPFTNRIMDHISARDKRDKAVFRLFKPFSGIRVLFFARFFGKICNCRHVVRS